jgi:hypothetical protein
MQDEQQAQQWVRQLADEMEIPMRKNMERAKGLTPVFATVYLPAEGKTDPRIKIDSFMFRDGDETQMLVDSICKAAVKKGAIGTVAINEVWYADEKAPVYSVTVATGVVDVLPRFRPDRKEGVSVVLMTAQRGWCELRFYPFHRDGKKIVWEEPWEPTEASPKGGN